MKKNLQRLILSPLILCLLLCFTASPAYASKYNMPGFEHTPHILTVMGTSENGDAVYLTNDCKMSQSEFHKYSGEEFDLKYGDVIKVYCCYVLLTFPGQFAWSDCGEEPKIEYLGKAADYFENKKELVVTEKPDRCDIITFEDSNGTEYIWRNNFWGFRNSISQEANFNYKTPPEFDPALINVGDKLLCVMSNDGEKETVYLPVSKVKSDDASDFDILAVTGVSESRNIVYLSNDCEMSQSDFHKYSGKNFDLKYGDAIKVYSYTVLETYPGQFSWCAESKIEYLGKALKYFENKKELVVKEKSDHCDIITFEDSDGTEYEWRPCLWGLRISISQEASLDCKIPSEFDPELINVGDKLLCVMSNDGEKETVYLPVSEWIDNVPGFEHSHPALFSQILTVMGVSENEDLVYLTNGCAMYQSEFHEYSGKEFDLQYGDVIKVYCCSIKEIFPSQFSWCAESRIEYLGKAADYFENKKELVVTKKSDRCDTITFEDSDGTEYVWKNSLRSLRNSISWVENLGCKTPLEFDPDLINVGDKLLCVVSTDDLYYGCGITFGKEKEGVYLPVSKVEESADNSKTFSVANLVYMQKYLTHSYEDSIQRFSNCDLNDDGSIDVFDVIILRRMILSKNLYIY